MTPGTPSPRPPGGIRQLLPAFLAALLLPVASGAEGISSNPDFESGAHPWFALGACTVSVTGADPHGGFLSAWIGERTDEEDGIGGDLLGQVSNGQTLEITAWVRLDGDVSSTVRLSVTQEDDAGERTILLNERPLQGGAWQELYGFFTLEERGALRELTLRFDGPAPGVTFLLDDVTAKPIEEWRKEADARIETHRKGEILVRVTDGRGRPVPDLLVEVRQIRHHFAFGSAVNGELLDNDDYAEFFFEHFEWGVLENQSKWRYTEPVPGEVSYEDADAILTLCEEKGIRMRGHTLLWDVPHTVPYWVRDLPDDEIAEAVEARMSSAVPHFAGRFRHWDVNNEILVGGFYEERLGRGIYPWMFHRTRELEPNALLFLNEHKLLTGDMAGPLVGLVRELQAEGAPVGAIGAQGHFYGGVNPYLLKERLDRLSAAGLPIWITEFDSLRQDEHERADDLEALYRVAFSHPSVHGILMWGFWAGNHWRGAPAAIVDLDWNLNAAGLRYETLMRRWTTTRRGNTDLSGERRFRGFHGRYVATVTGPDGTRHSTTFELLPGTAVAEARIEVDLPDSLPRPWIPRSPLTFSGESDCSRLGELSPGCPAPRVTPEGELRSPPPSR